MQRSTGRRSRTPASRLARLRACLTVGAWVAGALFAGPVHAHEAEQYTLPVGRDFADLGPYFTTIAYDSVAGAVVEVNAAIHSAIDTGATDEHLRALQSADYIAGKVWGQLFTAIPTNEFLDATLISEPVQSRYPGLVTMHRPAVSIYDDPLLVIDLTKVVRTFFRAGTVSVNGIEFGSDKIIHFINIGRIYHAKYETRIKRGLPPEEAARSAIESTARNPLFSEDAVLGMLTTGIHSNGDLAADYAGLLFYRNLTETVRIGPRVLPPILVREGPYWRVQAGPDSDFFVVFVTPHWNEALNPNRFARYTSGRMRTLIAGRCPDVLDRYRDPRGQLRQRAQFEALEKELSTHFGFDYGHERNAERPATIADVCFAGKVEGAEAAGRAAAPQAGPDALGRTELWWAARRGDIEQVRRLARLPDIGAADNDGETPLHAATRAGSEAVVSELLARGAVPDPAALYGVTPLMLAADRDRGLLAAELLAAGADPNRQDLLGMTALHIAARSGSESVVAALLARGADTSARSATGATPHDEAVRHGHTRLAQRLSVGSHAGAMDPPSALGKAAVAGRAPTGD